MTRTAVRNEVRGENLSFRFLGQIHSGVFVGYTENDQGWLDIKPTPDHPLTYSVARRHVYRGAVGGRR